MTMDKAEFLRIMALPKEERGDTERTSWVNILAELQKREEPFTKAEVAKEFNAPEKYVYSHLNDWFKEGKLAKINYGGRNVYLAVTQIPEDE